MSDSKCTSNDDNCRHGKQSPWVLSASSGCIFIGGILGMLGFGLFGDILGGRTAMILTLLIATLGSFLSAVVPIGDAEAVYATIICCRFILGIGNGGIFPLSAVKAAQDGGRAVGLEGSQVNSLSSSWAYFWQMPALCAPWLLGYVLSFSSESSLSISSFWRLLLGFGSVLSGIVLVFQLMESMVVKNENLLSDVDAASHEQATDISSDPCADAIEKSPGKWEETKQALKAALNEPGIYRKIVACGGNYFLYNAVFFGVTLSAAPLVRSLQSQDDDVSSRESLRRVCEYQMIASSLAVPGGLLAMLLQPKLGLKRLQTLSFLSLTVLFLLLASLYNTIRHDVATALFGLYCLLNFALQAGVNVTVYSLPSATFDKEVRSTMNGVTSAMGKLGAAIGAYGFTPLAQASVDGFANVMGVACVVCALGTVLSHTTIDAHLDSRGGVDEHQERS